MPNPHAALRLNAGTYGCSSEIKFITRYILTVVEFSKMTSEVSVIGQIVGASEISASSASCSWRLETGPGWTHTKGETSGTSQCDTPAEAGAFVWQHPIDVTIAGSQLSGWPRLEIEARSPPR